MKEKMKRKIIYRVINLLLIIVIIFATVPKRALAGQTKEKVTIVVNGSAYEVKTLNHEYDNNMYISLQDLAKAFRNTSKEYKLVWTEKDGETNIVLQSTSGSVEDEDNDEESDDDIHVNYTRKRLKFTIDGEERLFYAIPVNTKNGKDCYVNCGELLLTMNVAAKYENNSVYINTDGEFDLYQMDMSATGLPYMADSCLVGDATTGNIFYSMNEDEVVSIASTTKLMTYLVIKDAIENGQISMNDTVTFSEKASELSKTSDGVINVEPGKTADIEDVIKGMLIVSSNECSLALAEHLCAGDEKAFVEMMNHKALALGLSENVQFYNPHGLPAFNDDVLTVKQQNHLTATDMFKIASHILDVYPEITEITSIKETTLSSLGNFKAKNTNVLLYNVPGCVGLKTGTTNKAASCLVTAYPVEDMKGVRHYIVSVVYGCENAQTQSYSSMVLLKYGIQRFNAAELGITPERGDSDEVPETLEGLVGAVLNTARRK